MPKRSQQTARQIRRNKARRDDRAAKQQTAIKMAKELRQKMVESFYAQTEGDTSSDDYAKAILNLALSTDTELIQRYFQAQQRPPMGTSSKSA